MPATPGPPEILARPTLPSLVVFDLDGTLVDTGLDLAAALNHVLSRFGRPAIDAERVRDLIGQGAAKLIERGLDETGGGTSEMVAAGLPHFMSFYAANICNASFPYDGVEAALDGLVERGVRLAICTNKPERLSRQLIGALGWSGRFSANVGGDRLPVRKPHPLHLLETIAEAGGVPAETVFVGDTIIDVTAARAAEVPVVAVGFGFADRPPETLGADVVIHHFDELLPALERLERTPAA